MYLSTKANNIFLLSVILNKLFLNQLILNIQKVCKKLL